MVGIVTASIVNAFSSNEAANTQADAATSAANTQASANTRAAELQLQAQQEANALQKEMYYKNISLQEPWRQAGQNALTKLTSGINSGQFGTVNPFSFTGADFAKQQDPGYAFRLAEGNKALNQAAAVRGGLISGNALKAAQRYGQEMGSQEFQNAYNRALTGYNASQQAKTNAYNQLAGVSGTGQTSAQQIASLGSQYASNVGTSGLNTAANIGNLASQTGASSANAQLAGANARASSYGGIGQSVGQGLQGLYNNWNTLSNWFGNNSLPDASGQYSVQGNSDYYYDL